MYQLTEPVRTTALQQQTARSNRTARRGSVAYNPRDHTYHSILGNSPPRLSQPVLPPPQHHHRRQPSAVSSFILQDMRTSCETTVAEGQSPRSPTTISIQEYLHYKEGDELSSLGENASIDLNQASLSPPRRKETCNTEEGGGEEEEEEEEEGFWWNAKKVKKQKSSTLPWNYPLATSRAPSSPRKLPKRPGSPKGFRVPSEKQPLIENQSSSQEVSAMETGTEQMIDVDVAQAQTQTNTQTNTNTKTQSKPRKSRWCCFFKRQEEEEEKEEEEEEEEEAVDEMDEEGEIIIDAYWQQQQQQQQQRSPLSSSIAYDDLHYSLEGSFSPEGYAFRELGSTSPMSSSIIYNHNQPTTSVNDRGGQQQHSSVQVPRRESMQGVSEVRRGALNTIGGPELNERRISQHGNGEMGSFLEGLRRIQDPTITSRSWKE